MLCRVMLKNSCKVIGVLREGGGGGGGYCIFSRPLSKFRLQYAISRLGCAHLRIGFPEVLPYVSSQITRRSLHDPSLEQQCIAPV